MIMGLSKHRRRSAARRHKAAVRRTVAMRVKHDLLRTEEENDFHPSAAKHFGAKIDFLMYQYLLRRDTSPVLHVTCT